MKFKSASAAVMWAEAVLSNDGLRSSMGSLLKQGVMFSGSETAGDIESLARTITHMAANIDKPKGPALLAVYGTSRLTKDTPIVQMFGNALIKTRFNSRSIHPKIKNVQLQYLALCVMRDEKLLSRGAKASPQQYVMDMCGFTKYTWKEYGVAHIRLITHNVLSNWLSSAGRKLEQKLDELDLMYNE